MGVALSVYLYVIAGMEIDLFIMVLAHWIALLAFLTGAEEWSAGSEFLLDNWRTLLKALGVFLLVLAF